MTLLACMHNRAERRVQKVLFQKNTDGQTAAAGSVLTRSNLTLPLC